MTDVVVVGAGPAGLSAALELQRAGLDLIIVDDQPSPGGRIFANIERRIAHGAEDKAGAALVAAFRASGCGYLAGAEVWQIERGLAVFLTEAGRARVIKPRFTLLATGAQERPFAFPGWQLPGVMTVGAAQTTLKTAGQIPDRPVWLAGTGPLLFLYAHQLLAAGGAIAGILDTTRSGRVAAAARYVPSALDYGWRDLARGARWLGELRAVPKIRNVIAIEAVGEGRLQAVRYRTSNGAGDEFAAELLLVHDGVVPGIHASLAAGCEHRWNEPQRCFEPVVGQLGESSVPGIYIAGDGAGIAGARAAQASGRLAAIGIAGAAGAVSPAEVKQRAGPLRRELTAAAGFRRLIDTLYPPSDLAIPDATLVCRCEEVSARQVRDELTGRPQLDPDGVKIATRVGMGPCQGRQCGLNLTRLISDAHGEPPEAVGFLTIRPPLKPLTLGELATLESM